MDVIHAGKKNQKHLYLFLTGKQVFNTQYLNIDNTIIYVHV